VIYSALGNIAGVSVDDDGSLYWPLVDLIQFSGGAIFKLTETPRVGGECPGCINRVIPRNNVSINSITTAANLNAPVFLSGVVLTNYSGPSTLSGNIVNVASGGCNVLYAAVARSFVATDSAFDQLTEGLFPAPSAFASGTPSMVISFADCSGALDICTAQASGGGVDVTLTQGGILPVADGYADVAQAGLTRTPGVNNFRIFVQGNGTNLAPPAGGRQWCQGHL
jgi:hypothetical protein